MKRLVEKIFLIFLPFKVLWSAKTHSSGEQSFKDRRLPQSSLKMKFVAV